MTYDYSGTEYEYPASDYSTDGCNILAGSMPGSPQAIVGYNEGKTAVHEVGHWFGLLHTFQDNSCEESDPGDYIEDTAQEATSTVGCPSGNPGKSSCGRQGVGDPIHNYMDYSNDAWYVFFSFFSRPTSPLFCRGGGGGGLKWIGGADGKQLHVVHTGPNPENARYVDFVPERHVMLGSSPGLGDQTGTWRSKPAAYFDAQMMREIPLVSFIIVIEYVH